MDWGSIISAGVSIGTSIWNYFSQKEANEDAQEFSEEEAQKSRDYNTWLLNNQTQSKVCDA